MTSHKPCSLRDPAPQDEAGWRRLWAGYLAFYETSLDDAMTAHTWARILDPASAMFARLAERDGVLLGFSVNVLHEGSWSRGPICYLEDLFVDPAYRSQGVGKELIQDLIEKAALAGWAGLYWHTRQDNPARALYDRFIAADDFVRYRLVMG